MEAYTLQEYRAARNKVHRIAVKIVETYLILSIFRPMCLLPSLPAREPECLLSSLNRRDLVWLSRLGA